MQTMELTDAVARIIPQIEALDSVERSQLQEYLVSHEFNRLQFLETWEPELELRSARMDSGEDPGITHEELMSRLREKFG